MKKVRIRRRRIQTALAKIHLVDKFLIVFMILLLFQSTYNLFVNHTAVGESSNIDVIIRTSIAAIFGYFLSTNFIHHSLPGSGSSVKSTALPTVGNTGIIQNQLGFSDHDSEDSKEEPSVGSAGVAAASPGSCLQIIAASSIGLFCLTVLIVLRNVSMLSPNMSESASSAATVAQFRDIVSGCIGFLIGCPTSTTNAPN